MSRILGTYHFIDYLRYNYGYSMSRNTLSAIETGKTAHYDCELLFILCDVFKCELGYLLGEYDCRTGRITDISKETGLSEKAINAIDRLDEKKTEIISHIIENKDFVNLIEHIMQRKDYNRMNQTYINSVANYVMGGITEKNETIKQYDSIEDLYEVTDYQISKIFGNIIDDIVK